MTEENGSAPAGNPPAGGGETPWFESFQDSQVKEWTAVKGWKSPEAAAQSAWHLEKLLGADKAGRGVVWPKDETDAEGWKQIYSKLGRPETPDGYELKVNDGDDDSFLKAIVPKMHELGLPKKTAQELAKFQNEWVAQYREAQESEAADLSNRQFESLQKEWGKDFERNAEMSRRAIAVAGLTKEQAEAVEGALGVDVAAKVFAMFGENYIEHASPGHFNTGGDTKQSAVARIAELQGDREFGIRLVNGDVSAKNEWDKLHKIAYS